jgi:hypothetical protein
MSLNVSVNYSKKKRICELYVYLYICEHAISVCELSTISGPHQRV